MELDKWQKEVLATKGNICLRSGRQVGKSTVIGLKAARYALENPDRLVMVISRTERQASLLFAKILRAIHEIDRKQILRGKLRPTKHLINLKNKSTIHCLPAGDTGFGIMGFTIHLLIADEAAFIPEEVWNSIIPALAITRGEIWLLSTPFIKEGYYYNCFKDESFTAFHTSSEDCPRKDQVFLDHQKSWMTKAQYAQMYLGQFVDELRQFFSDELIKNSCILKRPESYSIRNNAVYFLGCDVARMDRDEFTYEIIERTNKKTLIHIDSIVTKNVPLPTSARTIMELNRKYNFRKEYIDSGGMGIAIVDLLRESEADRRKVVEINNVQRFYDRDEHKKKVMKEELYNNLKTLMETKKIKLLDDDEVKASLKSIQAEHDPDTGRLKIWGSDAHITEGLIRATWSSQTKDLNTWLCYP